MIRLSCLTVRHRLAAFYDGEVTIDEQVNIEGHLRECRSCNAEATQYRLVGDSLREAAATRTAAPGTLDGLAQTVVSRLKAEREESMSGQVSRMFEDLHLVWAMLGATGSTVACLALIVGIFYFAASRERPDSIAGLLAAAVEVPGSNARPVVIDEQMVLPRANPDELPAIMREDAVFVVAAMLTREGRISNPELLDAAEGQRPDSTRTREQVIAFLDSIQSARFQPARFANGSPAAVNMVWMVTHLTVRPKVPGQTRQLVPSVEITSQTFRLA